MHRAGNFAEWEEGRGSKGEEGMRKGEGERGRRLSLPDE